MKRVLLVLKDTADKMNKREELIKKHTAKNDLVKWSDYAVETKNCLYVLKVVQFSFPIQEFAGFDEVEAIEVLKELKRYVLELEGYLCRNDVAPDPTESHDTGEDEKHDDGDDEDDKSSERGE